MFVYDVQLYMGKQLNSKVNLKYKTRVVTIDS